VLRNCEVKKAHYGNEYEVCFVVTILLIFISGASGTVEESPRNYNIQKNDDSKKNLTLLSDISSIPEYTKVQSQL